MFSHHVDEEQGLSQVSHVKDMNHVHVDESSSNSDGDSQKSDCDCLCNLQCSQVVNLIESKIELSSSSKYYLENHSDLQDNNLSDYKKDIIRPPIFS